MAQQNSIKILEVSHVAPQPSTESPESAVTEFSLPLTFLDTFCFKFPPVECVFFYPLNNSDPSFMASTLFKLKHSLSLTLQHFLPLAGTLTWPPNSLKPIILYRPGNAVFVTVAESAASSGHFELLSGDHVREAAEPRCLVPKLPVNDTWASIMALQITVFPNAGFSIGFAGHHAVLDGVSTAMFMKSWAHICREDPPLSPELIPFFDRTVIKDQTRLDMLYLNRWLAKTNSSTSGSGRNPPPRVFDRWLQSESEAPSDLVRGTFQLTRGEIEELKTWVSAKWEEAEEKTEETHLSSFVVASAHVLTAMVNATEGESNRKVYFVVGADLRRRFDPPVPSNYFGNCVGSHLGYAAEARECSVAFVAGKIGHLIKGLGKKGVLEGAEERLSSWGSLEPGSQVISITWSPRFGVYGIDFGWGMPKKIEIVSVHRKAISLLESRDGNGGIEVCLVLKKDEMDLFASLFRTNLKAPLKPKF